MAHILVIDDNAPLREMLELMLTAAGHSVATAADGCEGVKLFRAARADLVITDLVMPNREGIETILALRRECPGLGIIAISGGSDHSATWLAMAQQVGACCTFTKPFCFQQLTEAIATILAARPGADHSFA